MAINELGEVVQAQVGAPRERPRSSDCEGLCCQLIVHAMASAPAVRRDRQVVRLLTLLKDLSDGRLQLTFRAGGTFEITRWILGWGDAAEVVRPARLRREVAAILRSAATQYPPS